MRYDIYGKAIKAVRNHRKCSQEQLMARTGMARSQIYYIESGERLPRIETLEAICQALDISLSTFFLIVEQIGKQRAEKDAEVRRDENPDDVANLAVLAFSERNLF
ncbi:MAG: helix-turn-helix transcriptional regulator [Sphaerochaetaceae bacterium]|nr:helix-turn-helix transcriptional regulator [Sphaerochaetaceae bacterium]